MQRYILKRLVQSALSLLAVTVIVFMLVRLSGDPAVLMAPPDAAPAEIQEMRVKMGLTKPIYIQYGNFIADIARGNFGQSFKWDKPCLDVWMERFPNTMLLAGAAMFFTLLIGLPVGILSAVKVDSWFDRFGKIFALMGQSLPVFWVGLMLMIIFAVFLGWLPTSGMGSWKHLLMPAFTLGWAFMAAITRLTRSSMLDALDHDYIKMARIKGVSKYGVVMKHAFKNALIPIITMGALNFVFMLNGTVITETVFNWPGIGRLVVEAIFARDFPLVQCCVLIGAFFFIFVNLFVDILYAYIDPRIRYS
ncbi:MAG: peptide/nickel transport system permease protein [Syntrophaceae bacterium]|nr:MAG: peptide/nickel transport system permease protein [Syntrophaceae bacterium]